MSFVARQMGKSHVEIVFTMVTMASCLQAAAQQDPEVETFTLPGGVVLEMVRIPAGEFTMGSDTGQGDEVPLHKVQITNSFLLGKFEVTKAQWSAIMDSNPWEGQQFVTTDPESPAVYLNFQDCQDFIAALNKVTGETFRLPTEAEWEYACRAGSTSAFSFGDDPADLIQYGWSKENAISPGEPGYARKVGLLKPNAFGLYDMHGNSGEWCQDYYKSKYESEARAVDPTGPEKGFARVIRGGSWALSAITCRSANREEYLPMPRRHDRGLRLAK